MPIDDALKEIEGESPKKKKKSEAKSADLDGQLLIDAQKCLGEWLAEDYFSFEARENKSLMPFLKNAAPYLLQIMPGQQAQNNAREFIRSTWLIQKINVTLWNFCLNSMHEYLAQTDMLSDKTEKNIDVHKEAKECFSELFSIENTILKKKTFTEDIPIHPYLIPMAMVPDSRPLIAVAIHDSLSKKIIELPDKRSSLFNAANDLIKYAPSLDQLAETAKRYKIHELRAIILDLSSALENYRGKWAW